MLKSTFIRLQMTNKSIKTLVVVVKDMLVKVEKFVLLTDFMVKNESITFKAGRGHLLPVGVGDIYVANVVRNEDEGANHAFAASPKEKKAKSKWVKQYLCGSKGTFKWVEDIDLK
ncbi:hypothetical protein HAX54_003369 [Datura stramonium]|uniref:Uncharacterized protein n=1 Tax=Datura stramonium TaxID=4076 RepID=A0ABS8WWQ1_DATST|nr:hypothetical protein [Datura stramonium]